MPRASLLMPGLTIAEAIQIQELAFGDRLHDGSPPVYKLSHLSDPEGSGEKRQAIGVIAQDRLARDSARLPASDPYRRVAEVELVVAVGHDGRIRGYAAGLELPSISFEGTGAPRPEDVIADNLVADRAVMGPLRTDLERADVEEIRATLTIGGQVAGTMRLGETDAWTHVEAMIALIQEQDWPMPDRTLLFTSAFLPIVPMEDGVPYRADFGALGAVAATIA